MIESIEPYGTSAARIVVDGPEEAADLAASVRRAAPDGVEDVVGGATTVVVFAETAAARDRVLEWLPRLTVSGVDRVPSDDELVEVPITYDGADLESVAAHCARSVEEVVELHAARVYRVAFCGFAPGFAYLIGGDAALTVPRLARPRTRVPPGSVGLAGEFCGVYPRAGPGGWQLIGTTDRPLWDRRATPPALLSPGRRVRFVP